MHIKQLLNGSYWPVNDAGGVSFNPRNFTKEQVFQLIKAFNFFKVGEEYPTVALSKLDLLILNEKNTPIDAGFLLLEKDYRNNRLSLVKDGFYYSARVLVLQRIYWNLRLVDRIYIVRKVL